MFPVIHNLNFAQRKTSKVYSSPKIIKIIKSRKIRWAENVALTEENRNEHRVLVAKSEGNKPFGG
jgi:hypothetical protein